MALQWVNVEPMLLAGGVLLLAALCIVSGIFFVRAQGPKRRTLEWIGFVDRPDCVRGCGKNPLCGADLLRLLLLSAVTVLLQELLLLRGEMPGARFSLPLLQQLSFCLCNFLAPVVCVCAVYRMASCLTGHGTLALAAAGLLALDLSYEPVAAAFLCCCCAFLLRWWGAEKFGMRVVFLLLCAVILAVGVYTDGRVLLFLPTAAVLLVIGSLLRKKRAYEAILAPILFTLFFLLGIALVSIPAIMFATGLPFPQMLAVRDFWMLLLVQIFRLVLNVPVRLAPSFDIVGTALLIYGLFAAVFSLDRTFRRRDLRGLAVFALFICGVFTWAFGGIPGSIAAAPAIAFYWYAWLRRSGTAAVSLSAAILLAVSLWRTVVLLIVV